MSKSGKLGKLKSILKRLHSSGRLTTTTTTTTTPSDCPNEDTCHSADGLHPVYVGKSRRRYLITSDLAGHPLFQVLLQRSGGGEGGVDGGAAVVRCEVVLFEHLLWMLENGDPENESIDELVEFYAC